MWVSVARAIRQPSWFYEHSVLDAATFPLNGGGLGVFQIRGNHDSQAEQLFNYEVGYRRQVGKRLSLDIAAFRNHYRRLSTVETGAPFFSFDPPQPHLVLPAVWENRARATTYGGEMFATWQVNNKWRISPGFSFLQAKTVRDASSNDTSVEASMGNSPKHQVQLRSLLNLSRNLEWDTSAYYVGALRPNLGGRAGQVGSYTRLDTRFGWRLGEATELSIVGQNLLSPRRFEFIDSYHVHATQMQRSVFGKLTWRF